MDGPGVFLWVSLPGMDLSGSDRIFLEEMRPAGVVLFSENIGPPSSPDSLGRLRELIREIRGVLAPVPVILAIDQEGGRVARLQDGVPKLPPMRELSRAGGIPEIFTAGYELGRALSSLDIDMDFAPVLDVDSNPDNPVIGDRSFSSDPELAFRYAMTFSQGLSLGGVVPCGKHFPGHGDTHLDSHFALPTVPDPMDVLLHREIHPFRRAVSWGIPALMTAHVMYPEIDQEWPATLSVKISETLLRKRLGFDGLLLSDDFKMAGLRDHFPLTVSVERSLLASCDGLLAMKSEDLARQMMEQLHLLSKGKPVWFEKRKTEAVTRLRRVLSMRESSKSWSS